MGRGGLLIRWTIDKTTPMEAVVGKGPRGIPGLVQSAGAFFGAAWEAVCNWGFWVYVISWIEDYIDIIKTTLKYKNLWRVWNNLFYDLYLNVMVKKLNPIIKLLWSENCFTDS